MAETSKPKKAVKPARANAVTSTDVQMAREINRQRRMQVVETGIKVTGVLIGIGLVTFWLREITNWVDLLAGEDTDVSLIAVLQVSMIFNVSVAMALTGGGWWYLSRRKRLRAQRERIDRLEKRLGVPEIEG